MPATMRRLLAEGDFRLRLAAGGAADDAFIDEPLSWAHSSDLADPTPWLEPGQLLLTDGAQFTERNDAFVAEYVDRLLARGVVALGFATGIVHDRIPDALAASCDRAGLPLFEVERRTPFIGIIRWVADVLADERRERLQWSLDAQRAVARAALRVDGLGAILLELADRLDCWVALYDSVGNRLRVPGLAPVPAELEPVVAEAVARTLARGSRAGLNILDAGDGITLQTIGQRGQLRGVLAVGASEPLDAAGSDVVESVIGLASIALEQRRNLDAARRRLRTGLFELLLAGVIDVADRTAESLWGALPAEPVRLTAVVGEVSGQALLDELELHADQNSGRLFFAERGGRILLITGNDEFDDLQALLLRHGLRAGTSGPVRWNELPRALTEAGHAGRAVSREHPFILFERLADEGMQGLLAASGGEAVARRILRPLLDLPLRDREALAETLRVWLEHNGAWDPAARQLGIHRHTLRNRVAAADTLLGLDLEQFAARAELWSALQLIDPEENGQ
ncbi:PucR family transcriptional regulator [Agreia pratensis]|uniref:Purine catabolism regulatory protein n=1 Tax=Agreia pratensis TaxID=150121 RepID=A0A1X7ISN5_9MICO|nr:PucR family transcriptional regulator [Agreia pratensis]SMG17856.1 purine catabolism regulatory protein [Agreia pratensis]